jgi:hypothetical protein
MSASLPCSPLMGYAAIVAHLAIANPKQIGRPGGKDAWYPYYAGFSSEFARTALNRHPPVDSKPVLDQWNGGGTTTQAGDLLGLASIGCDINPAMIVVAKARRLQLTVMESIPPLARQLLRSTGSKRYRSVDDNELLTNWFTPSSVASIRSLERSIRDHFIPETCISCVADAVCAPQFSDLAAYFYLILFRTVRRLLWLFRTANPTWVRIPPKAQRLRPSAEDVKQVFLDAVKTTLCGIDVSSHAGAPQESLSTLILGDSRQLPLATGSIGAILTSPPYLTRLDYAVSTAPELAILGQNRSRIRALRETMIGTTVITGHLGPTAGLGEYTRLCLDRICAHASKASRSYYYKNTVQYFRSLRSSLREASRVLAPSAPMAIVVQDSYYKEIHLDLPRIVREFAEADGLDFVESHPFQVERHFGRVHPHHRKHCGRIHRVESVVVMRKPKEPAYVN